MPASTVKTRESRYFTAPGIRVTEMCPGGENLVAADFGIAALQKNLDSGCPEA